jgi:asparagine synthase (glutamine-hydrolysing)
VEAALQARSPGTIQIRVWDDAWGALSGSLGGLALDGDTAVFCDGFPQTSGGVGPEPLLRLLTESAAELPHLEEKEGWEPGQRFLDGVTGDFSAVYYDDASGDVFFLRDRMGTRPAYWAEKDGFLYLASECSILRALGLQLSLDPRGLDEAFRYRWVSEHNCLWAPAHQLAPGSSAFFKGTGKPRIRRYWRFRARREPFYDGAMEEYQAEIDAGLRQVISNAASGRKRIGLLLSGGIDSSLLAALCAQELERPVAYCGYIPGYENPEWERARTVAEEVGMDFRSVEIDPTLFAEDFAHIARRLQELPRHVNTLVLTQIYRRAQQEVDVLMQGDAADTLFGLRFAYRLRHHAKRNRLYRLIPKPLKRELIRFLEWTDNDRAWFQARLMAFPPEEYILFGGALRYRRTARRILGISDLDLEGFRYGDCPEGDDPDELKRIHLIASGVDGSLIRHDRLTRPLGIESFAPFLTHTLVEIASRIPFDLTYSEVTKPTLRGLLDRYLPPEISRWEKVGFVVPEREWLFGPILPLFEEAADAIPPTGVLPKRYFTAALRTQDREAVISGTYLYIVMKEFGLV